MVVVRRDVDQLRFRVVRGRWPVLPAPQRRAEGHQLAPTGLPLVDVRGPAGSGIDALERVLSDVRLGGDERDLVPASLEQPQVSVASWMHQSLDRPPVPLHIDEHGRGDFVPVPRIVPVVLVVRLHGARVGIERDHRTRVEVVAGVEVARPRTRVANAPERQVELRVVRALNPDRPAAVLPVVPSPGLGPWLARRRDRIGPPQRLTGLCVEGLDEAPDGELAARRPHHDLASHDQRRQRAVVPLVVIVHGLVPDDLARFRVEGDQVGVDRGQIDLVLVERYTPVGRVELEEVVGQFLLVEPQDVAALRIQRHDLILRRRDEHDAVVDHRR